MSDSVNSGTILTRYIQNILNGVADIKNNIGDLESVLDESNEAVWKNAKMVETSFNELDENVVILEKSLHMYGLVSASTNS